MKPSLQLLDQPLIERILGEAFELLEHHGVKVQAPNVIELLCAGGTSFENGIAKIPESVCVHALATVPREFFLHNRAGEPVVHYAGDSVHFDPGSSCLNILDADTLMERPAKCSDLVRLVQVAEMLPQYSAQSTALVCEEAPEQIADLYRLFVVLRHSQKPVITGAFSARGLDAMLELLAIETGGRENLKAKPRAVFDVCPSPPLNWSGFGAENLIDLARAGVPAELISMPLAGATAPVTLAGSVVQHAAESISGIVIHQLAKPGAPIVWGGAPAIFDMRTGTTPMGAIETAMLNVACAQVGKYLNLPTHGYLVTSDSKSVDAQAGMESAISAIMGALAGINMISGAGMLNFLACHSIEKVVIDAEAIAYAQRLLQGIDARTETLATAMFAAVGQSGEFLKLEETRRLFRGEQCLPSSVIDRGSPNLEGSSAYDRARERVDELVASYTRPSMDSGIEAQLHSFMEEHCERTGMTRPRRFAEFADVT